MKNTNFKFIIPWKELCPKCHTILKERKKEQLRVKNRLWMAIHRAQNKTHS